MPAIRPWEAEPGVYWEVVPKYTAEDWAKRNPIPPYSWAIQVDPAPPVDLTAMSIRGWNIYQRICDKTLVGRIKRTIRRTLERLGII